MKQLIALAVVLVSSSAFAQVASESCYTHAQQQAASMQAIDFGVTRDSIEIISAKSRKVQFGNKISVQLVINADGTRVPVEVKVSVSENALGGCTTTAIELGPVG